MGTNNNSYNSYTVICTVMYSQYISIYVIWHLGILDVQRSGIWNNAAIFPIFHLLSPQQFYLISEQHSHQKDPTFQRPSASATEPSPQLTPGTKWTKESSPRPRAMRWRVTRVTNVQVDQPDVLWRRCSAVLLSQNICRCKGGTKYQHGLGRNNQSKRKADITTFTRIGMLNVA